jgi:NAD(P)-dependent dehydrogenase (short-subunit alcohol dehydrogenase family)
VLTTPRTSSGIGYTTAEQLARHGAIVYVAARSEAKAHAAIEKIYANNKKVEAGKLILLPLDLADLDSVAKAAEFFCKQEDRLDILGTFSRINLSIQVDGLILLVFLTDHS